MTPWHIFPLRRGSKVKLAPIECASNNKEQIDHWGIKHPGCNWGVALAASGLLVIDVDCKGGAKGFESLTQLDNLPSTLVVRTPSGGRHFYFRTDVPVERPQHEIWPGIDLPHWVLIGGSHIDGVGNYRVEESDAVAQAPQWLLDLCRKVSA